MKNMRARIFEIKHFAVHDGDGIRTTVFFKGCPLKCVWCHNPEGLWTQKQLAFYEHKCTGCGTCMEVCPTGAHYFEDGIHGLNRAVCQVCGRCEEICQSQALRLYGREITLDELMPILLEDRMFYDNSNGGVTLSGGECLMQAEFCAELLKRLKENGIHTAVDTCGFVPRAAFDKVMPYTDVFLYDLKAVDEDIHIKCTGRSNKLILDNLEYISRCGGKLEIRIPYVPGYNTDQMEKMAVFLKGLKGVTKIKLLPYHDYAGSKYRAIGMEHTLPKEVPQKAQLMQAESYFVDQTE